MIYQWHFKNRCFHHPGRDTTLVDIYLLFLRLTELMGTRVEINYLLIFFKCSLTKFKRRALILRPGRPGFRPWFFPLISCVVKLLSLSGLQFLHLWTAGDEPNWRGLDEIMCMKWLAVSSFLINIHLSLSAPLPHFCFVPFLSSPLLFSFF